MKNIAKMVALIAIVSSCSLGDSTSDATYTVTFESTWSAVTHPANFPANPHFSGLIGATHNSQVDFWKVGEIASEGIESMAETGSKALLKEEIQSIIDLEWADAVLDGEGLSLSPGSTTLSFDITGSHPLVSLVTMIAPSPDWFVGVSGLNLLDESGDWKDSVTVDLYPYDSGTDSGTSYTSADNDTDPQEVITAITGGDFVVDGSLKKLGTFTFVKQ